MSFESQSAPDGPAVAESQADGFSRSEPESPLNHLLFIPDGNRRYAVRERISKLVAYRRAVAVVRCLAEWIMVDENVPEFSFFGLSYNNVIRRCRPDLDPILQAQTEALHAFARDPFFQRHRIHIRVIGELGVMPAAYRRAVDEAQAATAAHTERRFNLLLAYSGERDFDRSVQQTLTMGTPLTLRHIRDGCAVRRPVDFALRTAGESRLSDAPFFLMAYSEFVSLPMYFQDLTRVDVVNAIRAFRRLPRTFGR